CGIRRHARCGDLRRNARSRRENLDAVLDARNLGRLQYECREQIDRRVLHGQPTIRARAVARPAAHGGRRLGGMVRPAVARLTYSIEQSDAVSMKFHALNKRFQGKRAFITGAGSGLGLAIARALASDGWALGLFDRNLERLAVVEADLSTSGFSVLAYPGDVTQADELTVRSEERRVGKEGRGRGGQAAEAEGGGAAGSVRVDEANAGA